MNNKRKEKIPTIKIFKKVKKKQRDSVHIPYRIYRLVEEKALCK
jgi:hypothetical protein